MPELIWLITGCSAGLGRELTLEALKRGDKVIATARAPVSRLADLEAAGASTLELDVTWSAAKIKTVFEEAIKIYGHIDVLVCNAGKLVTGPSEVITPEIWSEQIGLIVYGTINCVNAVLPHFRGRRSGTIAMMDSVYSHVGFAGSVTYPACKHMISGYTKCLALELEPLGIKAISFDIGFIRTQIFERRQVTEIDIDDYAPLAESFQQMSGLIAGKNPGDPIKCVNRIIDVVKSEGEAAGKPVPTMVPIGLDAYLTVKKNAEKTIAACETWASLSKSVERDAPREGLFATIEHYA